MNVYLPLVRWEFVGAGGVLSGIFQFNTNWMINKYFIQLNKLHVINLFIFTVIPVDGGWCAWESWSTCSKFCYEKISEEQFRQRTRKCECEKPKHGGQNCSKSRNRSCDLLPLLTPYILHSVHCTSTSA
jgi:hypothetical protein